MDKCAQRRRFHNALLRYYVRETSYCESFLEKQLDQQEMRHRALSASIVVSLDDLSILLKVMTVIKI